MRFSVKSSGHTGSGVEGGEEAGARREAGRAPQAVPAKGWRPAMHSDRAHLLLRHIVKALAAAHSVLVLML